MTGYFLTHFHSDHYKGLNKTFKKPVYCSKVTANLVKLKLKVESRYLHVLKLGTWYELEEGTSVVPIDANQMTPYSCPGSVMFLFRMKDGQYHLHTGDFRAESCLLNSEQLRNVAIHTLFLDTTYCQPEYCFPTQGEMIEKTVDFVSGELKKEPKLLVVCGTYTIGKERIFRAVAEIMNCKIGVKKEKLAVLKCLEDEKLNKRLTLDLKTANLHIASGQQSHEDLANRLKEFPNFSKVLGIWPSGWEFGGGERALRIIRKGNIIRIGVPYSEHSSFEELKNFVQKMKPKGIILELRDSFSHVSGQQIEIIHV